MNYRIPIAALILVTVAALLSCAKRPVPGANTTVIRNVRVFDGNTSLQTPMDVILADGKIQSVSEHSESYETTTETIDGKGKFLIPGLIDSHMHLSGELRALNRELVFGVTTSLGMGDDLALAREMRVEVDGRASFKSAGMYATV